MNNHLPNHLGIIMDGNRRWALANGLKSLEGHSKGADVFLEITDYAHKIGIPFVSVFAFSSENWSRTQEEVGYLMLLFVNILNKHIDRLHKRGAKLIFLGSPEGIDKKVSEAFNKAEQLTKSNTNGTLAICLNYGGHQEIIDATKAISELKIPASEITEDLFAKYLYGGSDIPPVDLIVRTSGEKRLSGFMLWRSAYSELIFTDKFWPDFTAVDLDKVLEEFTARQRRFGA